LSERKARRDEILANPLKVDWVQSITMSLEKGEEISRRWIKCPQKYETAGTLPSRG